MDQRQDCRLECQREARRRSGVERGTQIAFFNGTGTEHLTPFSIPTDRPVDQLAVSDFDGDLVRDIAFIESGPRDERNPLLIAFGHPAARRKGPHRGSHCSRRADHGV